MFHSNGSGMARGACLYSVTSMLVLPWDLIYFRCRPWISHGVTILGDKCLMIGRLYVFNATMKMTPRSGHTQPLGLFHDSGPIRIARRHPIAMHWYNAVRYSTTMDCYVKIARWYFEKEAYVIEWASTKGDVLLNELVEY